jgi:hypothetical protein
MFDRWGEENVNSWWWVPIALAGWFLVSLAVGLCVGPVLRRSTEAREALEGQLAGSDVHHVRLWDELQASQGKGADGYTLNRNSTTSPSRMT